LKEWVLKRNQNWKRQVVKDNRHCFFISVREIKEALDDDYDDNDTDTILNSTCHAQLLLCATPLLTLNCKYKLATTVYYNYYS
jgi:hypothetical protein